MTLKEFKSALVARLGRHYDAAETESFFFRILEDRLGLRRIDYALDTDKTIGDETASDFDTIIERLLRHEPLQYILGQTHFFGMDFKVTPNVLIPRPETEELVDWILAENPQAKSLLDIGTGSGAIAIALAKHLPNAAVSAIDVSETALHIASENAVNQGVKIDFQLQDILVTVDLQRKYDVIVSNPPYVRNLEKVEIKPNVLEYEPHLALFVDDTDALLFYRKITELALTSLDDNGVLYFEINQYLGSEMQELLKSYGFQSIELRKDLYGNDRMLRAVKP